MRFTRFLLSTFLFFLLAGPAGGTQSLSGLEPMDDAALDSVQGQSGLAFAVSNVKIFKHIESVGWEATPDASPASPAGNPPPSQLWLTGITFSDGKCGPMRFNSIEPMIFRPFQNDDGLSMYGLENLSLAGSLEEQGVVQELRRVLREGLLDPVVDAAAIARIEDYLDLIEKNGYAAWEMDVAIDVDDFSFREWDDSEGCYGDSQSMGSLHLSGLALQEFAIYVTPISALEHVYGTDLRGSGIAFHFETRAKLDEFRWEYNDLDDELRFAGTYFVGGFDEYGMDGTGDVYEDPATWRPAQRFKIGNLNPRDREAAGFDPAIATFGVVTDPADANRGYIQMQLPMQGSIRMEEVTFGDKNFGPNIIDNLHVHHLQVDFIPWKN